MRDDTHIHTMTVTGYIPKNEPVERHEQGVTKSRKTIMTGGGRAWSEAEVSLSNMSPYCYGKQNGS